MEDDMLSKFRVSRRGEDCLFDNFRSPFYLS